MGVLGPYRCVCSEAAQPVANGGHHVWRPARREVPKGVLAHAINALVGPSRRQALRLPARETCETCPGLPHGSRKTAWRERRRLRQRGIRTVPAIGAPPVRSARAPEAFHSCREPSNLCRRDVKSPHVNKNIPVCGELAAASLDCGRDEGHASQDVDVAKVGRTKPIAPARSAGSSVCGERKCPAGAYRHPSKTYIRGIRSRLHNCRAHRRHRARDSILRQPAIGACRRAPANAAKGCV
jgi:hypothetical protein